MNFSKYRFACLLLSVVPAMPYSGMLAKNSVLIPRRLFCAIPTISIPIDRLEIKYSRCSGPGGQNVNKLNTKAEIRFKVLEADWIPVEARQRLFQYNQNKMNNDGELIITSQEHRFKFRSGNVGMIDSSFFHII